MLPLADALAWLLPRTPPGPPERVPLDMALGRILASPLPAACLPPHPLAAIDGLALRAASTEGASDYAPLPVTGTPVQAGDPMPPETDAVLPPHWLDAGTPAMTALAAVAAGDGVIQAGHDATADHALPAGCVLRPLHLVLLAALGHTHPELISRPRIAIRPGPGAALLRALATQCRTEGPPALVLMAGHDPAAFTTLHAHGIAIRPGETAAIGLVGGTPAILLPAEPLACATSFALLAAPALRRMAGQPPPAPTPATLTRKIVSVLGQLDAIRVRLHGDQATPLGPAEHGGLFLGATADGLVLAPEGSEGYPRGATVQVHPL